MLKTWRLRRPSEDGDSVYISEKFGVRSLHIGSDTVQSAMRLARPNDLEVAYTRAMMAFLLFHPEPRRVLMIGLGGGSLAKFIYHRFPQAQITAVEVNPRVVAVARQLFALPPDDARLEVVVGDGVEYLNSPARAGRYDVLMIDGYDGESQVAALATSAFYAECARVLSPDGVTVVNLWGGDREFRACVNRLAEAFDGRVACLPAGRPGNVAALAFRASPGEPAWKVLLDRAAVLESQYGLEFTDFVQGLSSMNPHDATRLVL